mgnify:CR=1 FL=1|jgi:Holliday junction resolvasome RuvABC endonuclease subunit
MSIDFFVGIDPGQYGAVAVLSAGGDLLSLVDMPGISAEPMAADVAALLEAVGRVDQVMVGIEEPFAVSQNSSASSLTQGQAHGILLGVIGTLHLRHERIKPVDWKRELKLPMGKGLTAAVKKRNSREHASRLWPASADLWAKASQDGRAEAALIGECLRRRMVMRTL